MTIKTKHPWIATPDELWRSGAICAHAEGYSVVKQPIPKWVDYLESRGIEVQTGAWGVDYYDEQGKLIK